MSSNWATRNNRTSKRGLFVNGIWHCDCESRLPAEKFQVKNGGKHHGRWFYTCQRSQPKRCQFFLWSDDAKVREEAAVLNNSKTEPCGEAVTPSEGTNKRRRDWRPEESVPEPKTPRTPMRQTKITEPMTPRTSMRQIKITEPMTPVSNTKCMEKIPSPAGTTKSKTISPAEPTDQNDDMFDWSSGADDELVEFANSFEASRDVDTNGPSPRKSIKIALDDSPSKKRHSDMPRNADPDSKITTESSNTWLLKSKSDPVTASTSRNLPGRLLSPDATPAHQRQTPSLPEPRSEHLQHEALQEELSPLALEALTILSPIRPNIPPEIEYELVSLLNRHDLRTQGVLRGRDIARVALHTKEKKMAELRQRIASLEAEKDTNRTVMQHLKTDMASIPKKGRRSRGEKG